MSQWVEVRHLHLVEGVPKKEIARRLKLDVKTVRRAIGRPTPPVRVSPPRPSTLAPWREQIKQWLCAEPRLTVSSHFELINSGRVSVHRAGCLVRRRLDEEEDDGCGRCAKPRLRGFANSCGRGCLRPQEWRRPQPPELAGSDSFG